MAQGINIAEIRNEYLKKVAQEVDALGKSKKDNYIDDLELSLFIQKAQEQKGQFTQESFAEVMGLYKNVNMAETDRVELSWSEIGKQGLKSAGNFFKGMFCDEEGFSLKRTAATLGTIGGFVAVSAIPVVGPYIALTAGAGLSGYMGYNGAKNLIEGTKEYYNAKTLEEAQAAMEKTMDGGVETGFAALALLGIRKGVTMKANSKVKAKTESTTPQSSQSQQSSQVQQAQQVQPKPEVKAKSSEMSGQISKSGETVVKTYNTDGSIKDVSTRYYGDDGSSVVTVKQNGKLHLKKETWKLKDGDLMELSIKYNNDGSSVKTVKLNGKLDHTSEYTKNTTIERDALGNKTYKEVRTDNGQILERDFFGKSAHGYTKYEYTYTEFNGLKTKIRTDANGKKIITENTFDKYGNVTKQTTTYEAGVIETTESGSRVTYQKGMIKEITFEKGLKKEVHKDMQGNKIATCWYDTKGEIIKREFATPDAEGRIRIEIKGNQITETYSDGHQNVTTVGENVRVKF